MVVNYEQEFIKHTSIITSYTDVIEIAPYVGRFTKLYYLKFPKTLTLIEPNKDALLELSTLFPTATILNECVEDIKLQKTDVVVCCGLLYHLHSPIALYEKIVNEASPNYIIMDSINVYENDITISTEEVNSSGTYHSNKKTVGKNIQFQFKFHNECMNALGYVLHKHCNISDTIDETKQHSWLATWKKVSQ